MQNFPLELIIEVLVAILLVATVFYCHVLNRRLKTLREGQDGLRELIESLNVATERARLAIAEMKTTSESSSIGLQEQVGRARALTDELSVIVESGNKLAGRIETNLTGGRGRAPAPAASTANVAATMAAQEVSAAPAQTNQPVGQGGGVAAPSDDPEQARQALMDALRQTR